MSDQVYCYTCNAGPWGENDLGSNGLSIAKLHRQLNHNVLEFLEFQKIKCEREIWGDEDRKIFKIKLRFNDKKLSYLDYAKTIHELCFIKTLEDTQECLFYVNGIYHSGGEIKIKKLLLKINPELKLHEIKEIIGKIKQMTGIERNEFDKYSHKVCLKNCIIDIKTRKIESHDPEKLYRIKIPITYDSKARCPKFTSFVNTCLSSPDERIMIWEQMSSALFGNFLRLEAMYFHTGMGDNGKSTFFEIIRWLFGKENISTVSLHDLVNNRFAKARLEGKLLNIFPDIGSDSLKNLNAIKPIISGDPIDVEYKYQNQHTIESRAKMFFSANELPEIKEKTFADFKRIRVIKWTQRFLKTSEYVVKLNELKTKLGKNFSNLDIERELASLGFHKMNKQFIKSITDDETEKSGIFYLLLVCASKIIQRDGFSREQRIEEIQDAWSKNSTALESFTKNCILFKEGFVTRSEAYLIYYNYCKTLGKISLPNNSFQIEFQKLISLNDYKGWIDKKRIYRGVSWNMENETVQKYVSATATTDKKQNLSPGNSRKINEEYE